MRLWKKFLLHIQRDKGVILFLSIKYDKDAEIPAKVIISDSNNLDIACVIHGNLMMHSIEFYIDLFKKDYERPIAGICWVNR